MKKICPFCMKQTECFKSKILDNLTVLEKEVEVLSDVIVCNECNKDWDDPESEQDTVKDAYLEYLKYYFYKKYNKSIKDITEINFNVFFSKKDIMNNQLDKFMVNGQFNDGNQYKESGSAALYLHYNKDRL